jgi:hypothetical protein
MMSPTEQAGEVIRYAASIVAFMKTRIGGNGGLTGFASAFEKATRFFSDSFEQREACELVQSLILEACREFNLDPKRLNELSPGRVS